MTDKPPARTKPRHEWTVEEIVQHGKTGDEPLSDEWRSYVTKVAADAGLDPADLGVPVEGTPEEATVEQHLHRIQGRNR